MCVWTHECLCGYVYVCLYTSVCACTLVCVLLLEPGNPLKKNLVSVSKLLLFSSFYFPERRLVKDVLVFSNFPIFYLVS